MHEVQGTDLSAEELLTYISESSTMSKSIEEYEGALNVSLSHLCDHDLPLSTCSAFLCQGG